MKIAISGSTGLIGSALRRQLESNGHEVIPVVRVGSTSRAANNSVSHIEWDPKSGFATPKQLERVDALIHLAGKSIGDARWTGAEKDLIRSSRVEATEIIASQLISLDSPPPTIISASAIGLYGDRGVTECIESDDPGTDFLATVVEGWESACQPLRDRGLRVIHPRFGIVLSKGGGALAKMLPLFGWGVGGRLGSGRQYWSWISLRDAVRALEWFLHTQHCYGPYNLTAPSPATNAEFTRALGATLNRPTFLPVPEFALRTALGEMADALLLTSCRAIPERLLEDGFKFQDADLPEFFTRELRHS